MRTNSIGRLRSDIDELQVRQAKYERKLNIVVGALILCIAGVTFMLL
jgi:hypothetical protein